jgi:hypothetical protein
VELRHSRGHKLCSHSIVSLHFMEPEGSLPSSRELSACTYPEPDQSSLHHQILMLSIHLRLDLPSDLFPSGFLTNNLYTLFFSPIRSTCPTHLILLYFIILIILDEEYKSCRSSLCSFLHLTDTQSLFGPSILLSTLL